MATNLTAQAAETRIRSRVADSTPAMWTPTEVMTVLDDSLESIWTTIRTRGRDHLLERLTLSVSDFTLESPKRYYYEPTAQVGVIRRIEGIISSAQSRSVEIPQGDLDVREAAARGGYANWSRSQTGGFTIAGDISKFESVRVWYLRRWSPMHYGSTSGVGTTSTMVFASAPTAGRVVKRDIYPGMLVEFTAGALLDTVVRITAFDPATLTATFTPTLAAPVGNAQAYSLVIPVQPEHGEYVVESAASRLLERAGNVNYIMARDGRLARLHQSFLDDLAARDQDAPPFLYNNR